MKRIHLFFILPLLALLAACSTDPKVQSARYVANGNKYYDRGKYKEASIMYRRALQKDMKNAEAWYRLGLLNQKQGAIGEARGDFVRVADLAEQSNKFDAAAEDSNAKSAEIDYALYVRDPQRFKEALTDLHHRADVLTKQYPNSYNALRISGLAQYADGASITNRADRMSNVQKALEYFLKADKLKPYNTELGFAIISTLSETSRNEEAEKYAKEMIARKTADARVYNSLFSYYLRTNRLNDAEVLRKTEVVNNPKSGDPLIQLAGYYFMTKRQPEMVATLARLTSDIKTFPEAYMMVGDFYFSMRDNKQAIENYEKGAQADKPNQSRYLKKAAEAYTMMGNTAEAAKKVAELRKLDPNDTEAIAMEASLRLNRATPAEADKIIAQLTPLLAKTNPNEKERAVLLHHNLGRAYAIKGDSQSLDQARLQFQDALSTAQRPYIPSMLALAQLDLQRGENPKAVADASAILDLDPTNLTARLVRTMGLMNSGERDKARSELEAILKIRPDQADARFQLARLNLIQKHFAEADVEFERMHKAGDPRGMAGLVESKVEQGKADEAIRMLQDQVSKTPSDATFRLALASLEFNSGKASDAVTNLQTLLDQNPKADPRIRQDWTLRLGEAKRAAGDLDGAIATFNKAVEIDPKQSGPRLQLAVIYDTSGRTDDARKVYEEVLKFEPDNPVALNNLAYEKADSGRDLDVALSYVQKARLKSPQDPNIIDTLGLIYYKRDLIDDSIRLFSEIVNRSPGNATFHLHYAMALYKKGDKVQAKKELDLARRYRPSDREQNQINELFSKIG
jgi:tetratricopeptide (TPR) repeat protein